MSKSTDGPTVPPRPSPQVLPINQLWRQGLTPQIRDQVAVILSRMAAQAARSLPATEETPNER